jgi:hypothetical protein
MAQEKTVVKINRGCGILKKSKWNSSEYPQIKIIRLTDFKQKDTGLWRRRLFGEDYQSHNDTREIRTIKEEFKPREEQREREFKPKSIKPTTDGNGDDYKYILE